MKRAKVEEAATRRLARSGQRWTTARQSLVTALWQAKHPLTVPEICDASGVAISSAYRNLATLERAGVLHRIEAGEHSRYELAEDLSERHHHHLICSACGSVEDFEPSAALEQRAVEGLANSARKRGWQITGHRLDVVGVCAVCR